MFNPRKTPYQKVRCAIDNGLVTNEEISQALGGLEGRLEPSRQNAVHDEIARASRTYTFDGGRPGFFGRLYRAGKDVLDKGVNIASVVAGAAVGAEYQAAKAFAGTILAGKLSHPGDHLLYWLGQKTVEVSGPDMLNALYNMTASTPQIVLGMGAGALTGWLGYKIVRNGIKGIVSRWRKDRTVYTILQRYNLLETAPSENTQTGHSKA